ncbi:transglycosylase domain-containing protein [Tumebacillus sp. ITR2]|uniref:peptidoglycan glycosyltransferase n=1 Tax=Tumebacillus amylolyticus TaxID=2801339 RepID=A0ABS1J7M6_9BACL|nr:biosynthetic peptidoglycan transglycosylase [Tumebacillus amylolyticus]MBL0386195.1 transglycosylase domain-containing protein [Tumebacillus amylolyticus]
MKGKLLRGLVVTFLLILIVGCSLQEEAKSMMENHQQTTTDPINQANLTDIPDDLKMAIVDVEDSRFYEHSGLDLYGIGRAVYTDVTTMSAAEGGSTLTQQLARSVYLSQDRTFSRKVNEIALAFELEHTYSKDQILEMYLNNVYFGNGAFGIRAAAETYFGKGQDLKHLTLAECALLAGLPNAPSALNPWLEANVPNALARRNHVLDAMYHNGDITQEEMTQAKSSPLKLFGQ